MFSSINYDLTVLDIGNPLFPGSLKMRVPIPLKGFQTSEIQSVATKLETAYVSGVITYDDGFGKQDVTKFGLEYTPPPNEGWTARPFLVQKTN